MAQKKGFFYRLAMGRDDQPDFDVSKLPGTRWAVFKDVVRNRFGALVKINLLVLLFCLPAIAWMVYSILNGVATDAFVNYTGNLGFGFGANSNSTQIGAATNLMIVIVRFALFIPCLMIASIGFAGAFHTLKLLVWGEGVSVGATFFKGIKSNIVPFLWSSLIIGAGIMLVAFNFASSALQSYDVWSVLALVSSIILLVLLVFMSMYIWTQCVTYNLKFWGLIKNSFLLSLGMIFQNIFFVALTALPILLIMLIPVMLVQMLIGFFYIICGVSFTFLIWTIYAHYVFDKFINDRTPGAVKDRGVYRMSKEEAEARRKEQAERRKKASNTRFANPKKRKLEPAASAASAPEVTPLETTFSRRDLEKLAQEKKKMIESLEEDETQTPEDGAENAAAEQTDGQTAPKDSE